MWRLSSYNFGLVPALQIGLGVPIAVATFALIGLCSPLPWGRLDVAGAALFLIGSAIETGSELQRHAFKARPESKGRLFTGGLFGLAQHINYL